MHITTLYTILSVIIISLISLIGILTISINTKRLNKVLIYMVSFAAGAILGDTFIHLLPETAETFTLNTSLLILLGIGIFFVLEKYIHWHHCHPSSVEAHSHIHPFAFMNIVGDALHNFIDGIIIAASYLVSIPLGIATSLAVILHEIPQEIGDFGVLLKGGFTKSKALIVNFITALTAILGALLTILLSSKISNIEKILIPIAIGGFIYIAASDLIPELHKETNLKKSLLQLFFLLLGIAIMFLLLLLE